MLTRIDHVGIACRDLTATIGFYESTFGLAVASIEVNEAQGVKEAMLQVADGPQSVILNQVTFGIAVRMAVMGIVAGNSD